MNIELRNGKKLELNCSLLGPNITTGIYNRLKNHKHELDKFTEYSVTPEGNENSGPTLAFTKEGIVFSRGVHAIRADYDLNVHSKASIGYDALPLVMRDGHAHHEEKVKKEDTVSFYDVKSDKGFVAIINGKECEFESKSKDAGQAINCASSNVRNIAAGHPWAIDNLVFYNFLRKRE